MSGTAGEDRKPVRVSAEGWMIKKMFAEWIIRRPLFWGLLLLIGGAYAGALVLIKQVHGRIK